jgi:hypothetical protein
VVDQIGEAHNAMTVGGRLVAFLALAASDDSVLATGEDRSALAAASSVSWNNSGASAYGLRSCVEEQLTSGAGRAHSEPHTFTAARRPSRAARLAPDAPFP